MRIHGSPGEAISLDEYIEAERAGMTADRLRELSGFGARIFAKLATEQARQHHDLHEGAESLMRLIGTQAVQHCSDPLPVHLAEAGVALSYLLKGVDIIPDSIPEIGLTDDARVVARVLARNPELRP
ncbi:MAG: DUF1232 domain-containing protein [Terrimicrobiaceae bacterium]